MHSLSMLGVLIAGIGGFIFVSNWDTRRGQRRRMIDLLVFILEHFQNEPPYPAARR
jgi:hypothetical protein